MENMKKKKTKSEMMTTHLCKHLYGDLSEHLYERRGAEPAPQSKCAVSRRTAAKLRCKVVLVRVFLTAVGKIVIIK